MFKICHFYKPDIQQAVSIHSVLACTSPLSPPAGYTVVIVEVIKVYVYQKALLEGTVAAGSGWLEAGWGVRGRCEEGGVDSVEREAG